MATEEYIAPPVETDPDILAQQAFDRLALDIPGWEPAEGNLETIVLESTADMAATVRELASQVPTAVFRNFGASLLDLPPQDAVAAGGSSTWTVVDGLGYTIDAGTQVTIALTGSELYGFEVLTSVDIPPASGAGPFHTKPGEVQLQALLPGSDANGLITDPIPVDSLPWVVSVKLQNASGGPQATSGGIDAETDDDYLTRLMQLLRLMAPRPVVAADFATLYRYSQPGISRALAIDMYNPANGTYNNEKMVTVVGVDELGNPVPQAVKDAGKAYLQSLREVNFIVNTADPKYTVVAISTNVTVRTGYDRSAVVTEVTTALQSYLDPAHWGKGPTTGQAPDVAPDWSELSTVYYWEVITLVNNVDGVDRVTALTINGATTDLALAGPGALTRPGTITVTTS